jgi:histidyl-tRNA synthetase
VYSEKFKLIGLHPKESMEASFDIVTSTHAECMPEVEILSLLNDIIGSFTELADYEFKLVLNHALVLNAILLYAGIKADDEKMMKNIYFILADYNKATSKSQVNFKR